jgi:hypothetical protein
LPGDFLGAFVAQHAIEKGFAAIGSGYEARTQDALRKIDRLAGTLYAPPTRHCKRQGAGIALQGRSPQSGNEFHRRRVRNMALQRQSPSSRGNVTMSKEKIVEHHKTAADHHDQAAKHHRQAAEHHDKDAHEKAAHHAHSAHGHASHAEENAKEASKHHAGLHGKKGM